MVVFNVAPSSAESAVPAPPGSNAGSLFRGGVATPDVGAKAVPVGIKALSSGFEYSLVLLKDSTVVAWGANQFGQLGNGTTLDTNVPVGVCAAGVQSCPPGSPSSSFLHGVTAIAAGAFFNLALVGGNVMVWGRASNGSQGSLGTGTAHGNTCNGGCQSVPVEVCAVGVTSCPPGSPSSSYLQGVTAVAAGTFFALAILANNTVVAWGSNTSGQLGNAGVSTSSFEPVAVCAIKVKACPPGSPPKAFLSGVNAVSAGDASSLALQGHTVLAWGNNRYGEVGNGTVTGPDTCSHFACSKAPLVVTKLKKPVSAISAGNYHNLVIVDSPTGTPVGVDAWGSNSDGQVGIGSRRGNACHGACQTTPVAVRGRWKGLTAISGGRSFSLALVAGRVMAWGDNHEPGRLGNGTHKSTPVPAAACNIGVKACPPNSPASKYLHGVTEISGGGTVSIALAAGTLVVWGSNYRGALGTGSSTQPGTPFPIRVSKVNVGS
jgi:alpha-tubulin suppressor-like RCC1 family protein